MFGSMSGVFEGGGSNSAISGSNKSKMAAAKMAAILDNFEWPYLRNGSYDLLI